MAEYKELGYLAVRAQTGVPGLPSTYGVAKDKLFYEPAEKGLPPENAWSSEKYLLRVPKLFEALRLRHGDEIHLLHDVHHRLTPIEAARLGKNLEPYHLFWLEDPVAEEFAGEISHRSAAYDDATRGRGDFQFGLGCTPSDWRTID